MASEYTKVLKHMGCDFIVVGRGRESSEAFQKETDITPFTGGADKFLSESDYNDWKAIVAVTGDQLGKVTISLIKHGVKSILVEKPGGLDEREIKLVKELSKKYSVKVYVAYNRRFYASVKKAQEIIKEDGGILSFHFEFNELSGQVARLKSPATIKAQWLLHNSSHVIDLAFLLGYSPKSMVSQTYGSLSWHPEGAIFTGCGISKSNIPFTYHANWQAPGRWNLEIMTKNHRLVFRPMEKLQVQKKGSFELININLDDELDTKFKPGLFKQVESFLGDKNSLCTIEEQSENINWYNRILKGSSNLWH